MLIFSKCYYTLHETEKYSYPYTHKMINIIRKWCKGFYKSSIMLNNEIRHVYYKTTFIIYVIIISLISYVIYACLCMWQKNTQFLVHKNSIYILFIMGIIDRIRRHCVTFCIWRHYHDYCNIHWTPISIIQVNEYFPQMLYSTEVNISVSVAKV